eukprot:TRINITY_DN1201_c0_g1_i3.p1 TRINITY_DN1201_c0_g1~~TRINITY_DN1201_c0_g1_i3.p1  ORF type:complete len:378 (-),score=33.71 TRINITY_DN1201_c0_g1_i3:50-1183(-)
MSIMFPYLHCCYLGMTGLPMTSPDFMIMPPMFSRFSQEGLAISGVTELILSAITAGFGEHVPDNLLRVAEHALASVLYHWEFLRGTLPANHRLFANVLLLDNARRTQLQQLVICFMGNSAEARRQQRAPTGLPPHVMLMAEMRDTRAEVAALVKGLGTDIGLLPAQMQSNLRSLIEDGSIQPGQLTPQYLMRTVADCFTASGLPELVEGMRNGTLNQGGGGTAAATAMSAAPSSSASSRPPSYQRPSDTWAIPQFKAQDAWRAWVVGVDEVGPFHLLSGMIPAAQKFSWKKFKTFMKIIEGHVTQKHENWKVATLTDSQATALYCDVRAEIEIEGKKHKRRHDQLKWTTVLKNYEKRRAENNKRARHNALADDGNMM